MSLREKLAALKPNRVPFEMPDAGTIYLATLSLAERAAFEEWSGDDPDFSTRAAKLVICCACDAAEGGAPVFTRDDVEFVKTLDGRLGTAALSANAMKGQQP